MLPNKHISNGYDLIAIVKGSKDYAEELAHLWLPDPGRGAQG